MARHALLIGVSEFTDQRLARLNAPTNDVIALRGVLQDAARGGFDSVELSIDEDFLAVRDRVSRFFHERAPDDLLLFYYSGHGILGRGNRLYLATAGSNLDAPRERSIAAKEIREFIEECRAQRQVVVLDCCHSGAFAEHAKSGAPAPAVTADTFAGAEAGLYVLTAADALQFAWDGAELRVGDGDGAAAGRPVSRFTSWVVGALEKGEASPGDEEITMDELYSYVRQRAKQEGAAATPQRFVHGGAGDLVIARNPDGGAALIDPATLAALAAENRLHRLGAVTDLTLQMRARNTAQARAARLVLKRQLEQERDYGVRDSILAGLAECDDAEAGATKPEAAAFKPAQPARPKPRPAAPAPAMGAGATAAARAEAPSPGFFDVPRPAGAGATSAKPQTSFENVLKVAGAVFLGLIALLVLGFCSGPQY
jgi:uncharacterized caspase-like protein